MTDGVNKGSGLFWNTNNSQRSDITNYAGNGISAFDFWTANSIKAPNNIISFLNTGDISCNNLYAQNVYNKSYIDGFLNSLTYSIASIGGNISGNYYNKSHINGSLSYLTSSISSLSGNISGNYYNKSYVDGSMNYLTSSIATLSGNLHTINTNLLTNYYNKPYIDGSLNTLQNQTNSISNSGSNGLFTTDVRIQENLIIGVNNPAGTGTQTDSAALQYVNFSTPNS